MSQYVGRRYDGTLELVSSQALHEFRHVRDEPAHTRAHFVQTYSAIYELVYTASYEGAADLDLDYENPPLTHSNGQPIGPCFTFCLCQVPASPVLESYGHQIDNAKYGGQIWRSTLPYELLSDARVTIKLLYPIPLGLRETPILDTVVINPFDIPVAPEQQTFSPHWFTFLDINPADAPFYRPDLFGQPPFSMKDADIPSLPVTTPELAPTLTDTQWRELLGPARYYISTHPRNEFLLTTLIAPPPPGELQTHHPEDCNRCTHSLHCGICNALIAAPEEWTDRNQIASAACTEGVKHRLRLETRPDIKGTLAYCKRCGFAVGQLRDRNPESKNPPPRLFPLQLAPHKGCIRIRE